MRIGEKIRYHGGWLVRGYSKVIGHGLVINPGSCALLEGWMEAFPLGISNPQVE